MADEDEAQDFFFARGDEASNLAANEDPMDYAANNARIPGVNSLGGIGSQARIPPNFGLPPNQGGAGHVPSHVSVAASATSVVATSNYFGHTRRTQAEIHARRVICPKTARGAPGSREYIRHQEAATKALPHIFASAKHFHAKNSEGEASNKYANLQSEYAGNLAKIKNFKRHMDEWDMSDPFVIPTLIDHFALSIDDRWGERKTTGVHLLKNWGQLTLQQCRAWQRDSNDYASAEDLTSMEWARALMMNSCDALLVERIDEKFEELDLYEQGGVTYIKIALDEMFTISNTVVTTLQGFFAAFSKTGIAKVPNEDVRAATEQIVAVAERLAEVSALPTEVTVQILEGFTKCSVISFKETFKHLLVTERLRQLRTLTPLHDSSRLGGIKKLCKEANEMFNALNVSNSWNIPQGHMTDACFNCGDPDHGVPKCPKPLDQARIDKNKAEFSRTRGGRGDRGGRDNGGRGGQGRGRGNGRSYNRGKWKGDEKATSALLSTTGGVENGVGKFKGQWRLTCKVCGWNKTHTSGYHTKWAADPNNFSLPATHAYWSKTGKTPPAGRVYAPPPAPAPAPASGSSGTVNSLLNSRVGPLIAQYKTTSEDGQFASFLADFERALN
jgi:hypothetical protein